MDANDARDARDARNDVQMTPTYSVPEAARRLGVSESTIRRRIAAGKLPGGRHNERNGARPTWRVLANAVDEMAGPAGAMTGAAARQDTEDDARDAPQDGPNTRELLELIDRQQGEITKLHDDYKTEVGALNRELRETSNTATMFQTENRSLKEQNELLQGQVQKLLPPPAEEVEPEPKHRRWYWLWLKAA